jgi:hypothetical protein
MNPASSPAMNVPQTQHTAPVLEFRCLYTQDLRRKQKRWQDGRLKFHTFNKRVMVYDERSNFVGDTHWKGPEFNEGEEFELERGGILVEAGECIGKRDQDLFELVDKRVKDREERVAAKIMQASPSHLQTSTPAGGQLRPKTLNAVIGAPTGHYGRAMISNLSPFEEKLKANQDENGERPTKRRRQNDPSSSKNGYAQNLMGATLTLASARPSSTATIRYEPLRPNLQRTQANTIDLTKGIEEGAIKPQQDSIREESASKRSPPRTQKQKPRRSPLSKSGYASNLTGAALNLSRPGDTTSKGYDLKSTKNVPVRVRKEDADSSSPGDFTSKNMRINLEGTSQVAHRARQQDRNSSFALEESLKELALPKPSDALTKDSVPPIARLITKNPVSTLRIKARPPRKMMMLMDLPSSRSPAPIESLGWDEITSERTLVKTPAVHEVEPFQGNSFFKKPEERPRINLDDLSSSPIDSGIDHQTIDELLSRPRVPSKTEDSILKSEPFPNLQMAIVEPVIKTSTSSTPNEPRAALEEERTSQNQAMEITGPMVSSMIEQSNHPPPTMNVSRGIRKLANPATRGQSVRALANKTHDTVSPVTMNMLPLPRISGRPGKGLAGGGAGENQPQLGPVGDGGPWSRESFDLFGTWKPPGRDTAITT